MTFARVSERRQRDERRSTPATADDLEAELRRENPKGRLWTRCAQLGIDRPYVEHRAIGATHQAQMTLHIDEWELWSDVQSGRSRPMAEQLAARELLADLEKHLAEEGLAEPPPAPALAGDDDDVWEVGPDDAERLKRDNPKGQVFEWCQKRKPQIARPRFETRRVKGGGVHVRASLLTLGLSSPWFRAPNVTLAEQAAAEALLSLLPEDAVAEGGGTGHLDPRSALHTLRQRGAIADYVLEATGGDRASGRFTAVGRATLPSGAVEATAPIEAPSKREAALLAARALLERVERALK